MAIDHGFFLYGCWQCLVVVPMAMILRLDCRSTSIAHAHRQADLLVESYRKILLIELL